MRSGTCLRRVPRRGRQAGRISRLVSRRRSLPVRRTQTGGQLFGRIE
jgi:hypothetical protein